MTIKNTEPKEKINNTELLKETGLKIVHINNIEQNRHYESIVLRSMTIAYQQINRSHIKLATSVCHKSDEFSKKRGTKVAVENFKKGNTIIVPIAFGNSNITRQLFDMFNIACA